jgi:hypothetical protein
MTSPSCPPGAVTTTEIADLLAWARQLSSAGGSADPGQRAAYLAAKANLLARIADHHANEHPRQADYTHDPAELAAAPPPPKDTR